MNDRFATQHRAWILAFFGRISHATVVAMMYANICHSWIFVIENNRSSAKKDDFITQLIQVKVHYDMKSTSHSILNFIRVAQSRAIVLSYPSVSETYRNASQTLVCQTCQPDLCWRTLVNDLLNTGNDLTFPVLMNVFVVLLRHVHELCRKYGRVHANPWVVLGATAHGRSGDVIPRCTIDEHHLKRIIHHCLSSDRE